MQIGIDIVKSLRKLHEAGYVHNDLKPENILYGAAGSGAEVGQSLNVNFACSCASNQPSTRSPHTLTTHVLLTTRPRRTWLILEWSQKSVNAKVGD